ncbi:MAG: BLUF domain-containing protein, partial [Pseudomonadota bacterium]
MTQPEIVPCRPTLFSLLYAILPMTEFSQSISMYRLAYVSSARDHLRDDDIAHILDVSVNNNHERYITG